MVTITIDGKKQEREFQNVAQALAFAYQNGECYAAGKLEIACAAEKAEPEKPAGRKPAKAEETPAGPAQAELAGQGA